MRLAAWRVPGSKAGSSLAGRRLTVFSIGVAFLSIASFVGGASAATASATSGTSPAGPTPASRAVRLCCSRLVLPDRRGSRRRPRARTAGFHMTIRSRATALTALLRRLEQLLQLLARHGKSRAATFGLGSRALQWDTFG